MITLLLGLVSIHIYEQKINDNKKNEKIFNVFKVLVIAFLIWIAEYYKCDYGAFGVALVLITHLLYDNNKVLYAVIFTLMTAVKYVISYSMTLPTTCFLPLTICAILPIIPIMLYNGKKGPGLKYLFYIMYPLQFVVIGLLFINLR